MDNTSAMVVDLRGLWDTPGAASHLLGRAASMTSVAEGGKKEQLRGGSSSYSPSPSKSPQTLSRDVAGRAGGGPGSSSGVFDDGGGDNDGVSRRSRPLSSSGPWTPLVRAAARGCQVTIVK